eukprot:COSAG06_NODE_4209_length_4473_cov_275.412730_6_plen_62_part_00
MFAQKCSEIQSMKQNRSSYLLPHLPRHCFLLLLELPRHCFLLLLELQSSRGSRLSLLTRLP